MDEPKCDDPIGDKDYLICDGCSEMTHKKSTNLAPGEVRAEVIKKRTLYYFCQACKDAFKQLPSLVKNLNEMTETNKRLTNEINQLKQRLRYHNNSKEMDHIAMIQEIQERQIREFNVIVKNIQESRRQNQQDRTKEDSSNVESVLQGISREVKIKKVFRLGKFSEGRNRPLKVILNSKEEALKIIKNKNNLQVPGIRIYNDQTKMQRDYYFAVKNKLDGITDQDPFADASKGADDDVQDGLVHIRIQQRNGRKTLTTVQGLSSEYDLKKIVRACKKEFACNGTVIEHPEYGEVLQLQGDQRENICQWLTKAGLAKPDQLKVHGF